MHIKLQVILDDIRTLFGGVGRAFKSVDYVLQCFVLYVAGTLLDDLSSLNFPPGVSEANPFSRHADGSFYLRNALITEGVNTLEAVFISAGLYTAGRIFGKKKPPCLVRDCLGSVLGICIWMPRSKISCLRFQISTPKLHKIF